MRSFRDGDTIDVEPWRAAAFPVVRDLVVDRSAFDRIIQSGGYVSVPTGAAPEATPPPCPRPSPTRPSSTPSASARGVRGRLPQRLGDALHLAKINHLGVLPQGAPSARPGSWTWSPDGRRGLRRLHPDRRMRHRLPQGIPLMSITAMNKEWLRANRKVARG